MGDKWRTMISRLSPKRPGKLWTVSVKQRICSKHFVDKEPTYENPAPTLNLGYDSERKAKRQNLVNSRKVLEFQSTETSTVVSSSSTTLHATTHTTTATKTITPTTTLPLTTTSLQRTAKTPKTIPLLSTTTPYLPLISVHADDESQQPIAEIAESLHSSSVDRVSESQSNENKNKHLKRKIKYLTSTVNNLMTKLHEKNINCLCSKPIWKKLLISDKNVNFTLDS